jgi:hypothetical protein
VRSFVILSQDDKKIKSAYQWMTCENVVVAWWWGLTASCRGLTASCRELTGSCHGLEQLANIIHKSSHPHLPPAHSALNNA